MSVDEPRPARTSPAPPIDDVTSSGLELLAAGVTELVGFHIAAISVATGDELEVVAVSGDEGARRALEGSRTARHLTQDLLSLAEDWGALRFVPHERAAPYLSQHGWTPDHVRLDAEDAWDAQDMLFAPFFDAAGALEGLLAVDLPTDGLRPGPEKRRQLERYAVQAGRAVHVAVERVRLTEQIALATRARSAVREAARELSVDRLLEHCQRDLVAGFRASKMWVQVLGDGDEPGVLWAEGPRPLQEVPHRVAALTAGIADRAWAARRAAIVTPTRVDGGDPWSEKDLADCRRLMSSVGVGSALVVPLTDGRACLGHILLGRDPGDLEWDDHDVEVALDVGHDLGHAVAHARAFEREQALVRELQALDDHKSELIATLSHELKTPLASILGNLELLRDEDERPSDARGLAAIERGAHRLSRVVDDLMLLAKIGDPGNPLISRPVDLGAIVLDVLTLIEPTVQQRGLRVTVDLGERSTLAWGDPDELDRVVSNLVSNATKYTEDGGRIDLSVGRRGDNVVLACADDGIGISDPDQERLFREFFRSTNPRVLGLPGTGLGLAIVERIVRRHGGRIGVRSGLGTGSCFEVTLPAAEVDIPDVVAEPAPAAVL